MNNLNDSELSKLIPGRDKTVPVESHTNISVLNQLQYLVDCMIPDSSNFNDLQQYTSYSLRILDDFSGEYGGPYFKIEPVTKNVDDSDAYEIDIGYPTANIVKDFRIKDDENYSIYYQWQKKLNTNEYVSRLDEDGEWEQIYAPIISSKNDKYLTRISDQLWWSKATQYPIKATIKLKGLLRPSILMSKVKLNVLFYGKGSC